MSYQGNGTEGYPVEAFASAAATTVVAMAAGSAAAASTSATNAATNAATALTHATTSAINAGATLWVSGTTYAIGDARYSAVTGQTYRRLTAGAGTIDPSADATNWKPILLDVQTNLPTIRPTLDLNFAQSKTVDPRIGFTRATTATYYDGKTTSKAEENLFIQSQEFGSWSKTATTVLDDATAAPDLTTTADTAVATAVSGYHGVYQAQYFTSGLVYTVSVYVKPNGYTKFILSDGSNGTFNAAFDLTLGTVISSAGGTAAIARDAGTGWCRCSIVHTAASSASRSVYFSGYPDTGVTLTAYGANYTGDGTSGVYLWGAQIEQRSFLTAYTPTTTETVTNYIPTLLTAVANQPRINHDPVTGECLGLLVEPASSNLLTYSQDFSNAAWTKIAASTIPNVAIAPDGSMTASKLVESTATTFDHYIRVTGLSLSGDVTYSIYAKANGRSHLQLAGVDSGGAFRPIFDLTSGTVVSNGGTTATITNVGNGWYRCCWTKSSTTLSQITAIIQDSATYQSYTGDGIKGILVWGAQLEAQQLVTSYTPTTTTAVTRNADVATISGTNFTSFYNQTEGTVFVEANYNGGRGVDSINRGLYNFSNGTTSNRITTVGTYSMFISRFGNTVQTNTAAIGVNDALYKKHALAYKVNDFAVSQDASTPLIDSTGAPPTCSQMQLGTPTTTVTLNGHIKQLTYYPERLPNTTLQAMTAQ